jgi:hypothetical protein
MKKNCWIIFFGLILLQGNNVFSQEFKMKQYSSILDGDYDNDYSGVAYARYIENSRVQEIKDSISRDLKVSPINKLTKNNSWLAWKALGEWEYEPGETYGNL